VGGELARGGLLEDEVLQGFADDIGELEVVFHGLSFEVFFSANAGCEP
jgi:hypothetical protein